MESCLLEKGVCGIYPCVADAKWLGDPVGNVCYDMCRAGFVHPSRSQIWGKKDHSKGIPTSSLSSEVIRG